MNNILALSCGVIGCMLAYGVYAYNTKEVVYHKQDTQPIETALIDTPPQAPDTRPVVSHVPLPEQVKAIYMSACVVGTVDFRDRLVRFVDETEINALVIDIKDYSGSIAFDPEGPEWQYAWDAAACGARDMRDFLAYLHEKDIYVIGRITVFQDPLYTRAHPESAVKKADGVTVWKDYKGLSFIDVGYQPYWEHLWKLVEESYNVGFDEINFDYVRYPSDGPMKDIAFTHSEVSGGMIDKQANLERFFAALHEAVQNPDRYLAKRHEQTGREQAVPYTSADLFGMTTTNTDDLSIGQVLERALPYFDAIAPMVYPSHYPDSFLGLGDPNLYPYKVVHYAMESAVRRASATTTTIAGFTHQRVGTSTPALYEKAAFTGTNLRTWIQDFDYGGDYDAADVRAQIQASYDAGVDSWMVWAPSNIYTRGAYLNAQ
jgi:hypothetical protein